MATEENITFEDGRRFSIGDVVDFWSGDAELRGKVVAFAGNRVRIEPDCPELVAAMAKHHDVLDREILTALAGRCDEVTYVIRNVLDWPSRPLHRSGIQTSHVLTACRRLERRGHAEEARSSYAVMKTWRITAAGRAALNTPSGGVTDGTNG